MKTLLIAKIIIAFSIMNTFSQDISGVWHGMAKTPDDKEVLFVFLLEKNRDIYNATMSLPTFNASDIKPNRTTLKEGVLTIEDSDLGMKHEGIWNETTN